MARKVRSSRKQEDRDLTQIHNSYVSNLDSLNVFIINLTPVAKEHGRVTEARQDRLIDRFLEIFRRAEREAGSVAKDEKKKTVEFKLTGQLAEEFRKVFREYLFLSPKQVELLYKSAFVMLISYFDFLISDLIYYYYQSYPASLTGKELSLKLSELQQCEDISEAVRFLISKEVDRILYDSLNDQIKYFEDFLKIDCKKKIINWDIINEAVERRNIIVHNDSRINRRYLDNVSKTDVSEKVKNLKEGKLVRIDEKYFRVVFNELFLAGIILHQCCWRKWAKNKIEQADTHLCEDIYDTLLKEKWQFAERLCLFSKDLDVNSERTRLVLDINYCQCLKWQGKQDELESELKRFNTRTLRPIYELALCALESNIEGFYKSIEKAIVADDMKEEYFMEWPLFRELRKDRNYIENVKNAFAAISKQG